MRIIIDCAYQLLWLANIIWIRNALLDACYFAESRPEYSRLYTSDLAEGAKLRQSCGVCHVSFVGVGPPNITYAFESPRAKESRPFIYYTTQRRKRISGDVYFCTKVLLIYRVTAELHNTQFKCIVEYNRDKNYTYRNKTVTSPANYPPVAYVTRSGRFVVQCK